jgi:RHS repeat-associated protein
MKLSFFLRYFFVLLTITIHLNGYSEKETITFIHTDHLGSPVMATNEDGSVKWRKEYQPFGKQLTKEDTTNTIGFTGHKEDKSLGLTYMQARWYNSELGRFMSLDPLRYRDVHSFNRYIYANNNPYNFIDPDGRDNYAINAAKSRSTGQSIIKLDKCNGCALAGELLLPGAGAPSVYQDIKNGSYVIAGISIASELPILKPLKATDTLTASQQRAIRGLVNQVTEHQKKLSDFKANPDTFDNNNFLVNASPELREKIIQSRIKNLENQIDTFKKDINAIKSGNKKVLEKK